MRIIILSHEVYPFAQSELPVSWGALEGLVLRCREQPRVIGVAVIGCGAWGSHYVRAFDELPESHLLMICDSNEERLGILRQRYPELAATRNYEEVLSNPAIHAVVVATPPTRSFKIVQKAIQSGKHVLVEKPLIAETSIAESFLRELRRQTKIFMIDHTFLYNSAIRMVKDIVSAKGFGKIYYLYSTRANLGPIREDVHVIRDLAWHDIYIFNYLLDSKPEWVSAVGQRLLEKNQEDVGFITLSYPGLIKANIRVSWLEPHKVREVVIVGNHRRVVFDDVRDSESVRIFEKGPPEPAKRIYDFGEFRLSVNKGDVISPHVDASEPLKNLAKHFLECIATGKQPLSNGEAALDILRVMTAIDKSLAANGAPAKIE